jgi:hypothetical protein
MGGYLSWIPKVRGTGQESQKGNPVQQSEFWLLVTLDVLGCDSVRQSGVGQGSLREGEKRPMVRTWTLGSNVRKATIVLGRLGTSRLCNAAQVLAGLCRPVQGSHSPIHVPVSRPRPCEGSKGRSFAQSRQGCRRSPYEAAPFVGLMRGSLFSASWSAQSRARPT